MALFPKLVQRHTATLALVDVFEAEVGQSVVLVEFACNRLCQAGFASRAQALLEALCHGQLNPLKPFELRIAWPGCSG